MSWVSLLAEKNENALKNAKKNNLLKTKLMLNIIMSVEGTQLLHL